MIYISFINKDVVKFVTFLKNIFDRLEILKKKTITKEIEKDIGVMKKERKREREKERERERERAFSKKEIN